MPASSSYKNAKAIRAAERDRALDVDALDWPVSAPDGWDADATNGWLRRTIREDQGNPPVVPTALEELVLRFPSAPLHGFQRLHEHHVTLGPSENFHTFRVLRSNALADLAEPVSRVFLMHTGLNERDTMGLYYRLASQLIAEERTTVCVVRPFPGHLTRYPFQAFAETPLDNYLWDGSHLFRQFLRFMIETQWFLSTIVRRSSYRAASGASLLAEHDTVEASRIDARILSREMQLSWNRLYEASALTAAAEANDDEPDRAQMNIRLASEALFEHSIAALRAALHLERDYPALDGELPPHGRRAEPTLHVLGYSLGGFAAQSVFMSWPFLIASCSAVLGGGALRELAPTAFADPEEWQTVLHSLRYELDDRLMSQHLGVSPDAIGGIKRDLFTYFKRTFYEVFQQEYRGSFQTRLEAFRQRMLFIVGGDDPVVRPKTVLDSAPKGGVNLLEIGGIGHFLDGRARSEEEKQQRTFWLPEMAALIHRFANHAADDQEKQRRFTWFDPALARPEVPFAEWTAAFPSQSAFEFDDDDPVGRVRRLSPAELIAIDSEGALPCELFERCLDDLLYRVTGARKDGVLFILRNEIPSVMLHPSIVRESAAAHYHDDFGIVRYCHGVAARRQEVGASIPRIFFVLPWNARRVMRRMDLQRGYPSQSESAGGQVATRLTPDSVWEHTEKMFRGLVNTKGAEGSVRVFNGNRPLPEQPDEDTEQLITLASDFAGNERITAVSSLPDCWIWVSRDILTPVDGKPLAGSRSIRRFIGAVPELCDDRETVAEQLRRDRVRVVTVSRARYNPRFRGRLQVDGAAARKLLLHAALCLSQSQPIKGLEAPFE